MKSNYEIPHCGAFFSPHSQLSCPQIFSSGSCFQIILKAYWMKTWLYYFTSPPNNMRWLRAVFHSDHDLPEESSHVKNFIQLGINLLAMKLRLPEIKKKQTKLVSHLRSFNEWTHNKQYRGENVMWFTISGMRSSTSTEIPSRGKACRVRYNYFKNLIIHNLT